MTQARETARHDKESDEGLHALERVVAQDPKIIDAWFMLGNEYYRRRQFARAIEQFKRALELKPDYDLVVINMANAYRALGRDQEAMVGYRRFMELDPKNAQIRYETAQILIDNGKLDEAQARTDARARARAEAGRRAQRARRPGAASAATSPAPSARFARRSRRSPTSGSRTYNLALLAEQQGDLPRAIARIQERDRAPRQQLQGRVQPRSALRAGRRSRRARSPRTARRSR